MGTESQGGSVDAALLKQGDAACRFCSASHR
jgi:hypothetical protein